MQLVKLDKEGPKEASRDGGCGDLDPGRSQPESCRDTARMKAPSCRLEPPSRCRLSVSSLYPLFCLNACALSITTSPLSVHLSAFIPQSLSREGPQSCWLTVSIASFLAAHKLRNITGSCSRGNPAGSGLFSPPALTTNKCYGIY